MTSLIITEQKEDVDSSLIRILQTSNAIDFALQGGESSHRFACLRAGGVGGTGGTGSIQTNQGDRSDSPGHSTLRYGDASAHNTRSGRSPGHVLEGTQPNQQDNPQSRPYYRNGAVFPFFRLDDSMDGRVNLRLDDASRHRYTNQMSQSGIFNHNNKDLKGYSPGTKLYNYIIFNLALSVPLSVILIILSKNLGRIHDKFTLDYKELSPVWRHDISSIMLDVCVFLCYLLWIDYCVNGLILFRYVSIIIQVLAEKLTGYNGGETLFHVQQAQYLLLGKFSWKKWISEALNQPTMMDVYKFHSVFWLLPILFIFVLRNHVSSSHIPVGVQTGCSVLLLLLLSISTFYGLYLQLWACVSQLENFINKPIHKRGPLERFFFRLLLPLREKLRIFQRHERDQIPILINSSPAELSQNFQVQKDATSFLSRIIVQIFVFVLYFLIGGGCISIALRTDRIFFEKIDPWLLFTPLFIAIGMVMLYNLVSHVKFSFAYAYQNQRLYVKSAIIMCFIFVFLLIQSVGIAYISIGYALKIQELWVVDWVNIFLPLCIFEIVFSIVGSIVLLAAFLRMLSWMWAQARFVSRRSEAQDVEMSLELL